MLSNVVKTLNLFFYNMMSFSGHPVCCLGLIWCILLGLFLLFATKIGILVITGLIDQFFWAFYCKIVSKCLVFLDLFHSILVYWPSQHLAILPTHYNWERFLSEWAMLEILVMAPEMTEVFVGVGCARNPGHGTRNDRGFVYFGFTHW